MSRSRSKRKGQARAKSSAGAPVQQQPSVIPIADVDALLVRSTVRWSILVALLIALYASAVFAGYPYPDAIDGTRVVFYIATGIVLVIAGVFITFLGYRMMTMRVIRQGRTLYVIFLPAVMLLSAIVAILMLAAPT